MDALSSMLDSGPYEIYGISNAHSDLKVCEKLRCEIRQKSSLWGTTKKENQFVTQKVGKLPKLRGNPKIHKFKAPPFALKDLTFRPIIGGKETVLSGLSILLDKILQKITSFVPSKIKDSFDAIEKISDIDFSRFDIVPFDARALYTHISISLVHKMLDFWLNNKETEKLFPDRFKNGIFLHEGLEIIFTKNFFTFDGLIYRQEDGMAMGTNVAVSVADLSLGYLEIQAQLLPPRWYRYIDDGLFTSQKNEIC